MNLRILECTFLISFVLLLANISCSAQVNNRLTWSRNGNSIYISDEGSIVEFSLTERKQRVLVSAKELVPEGRKNGLEIKSFFFSDDFTKLLIFTNSKKVWRYETRGDYWVYDFTDASLKQLGKGLPVSSLMFAKFSPDGNKVAYVSGHNIYQEKLSNHTVQALTTNGSREMINGTFDWVYEEEFDCRDGFRWSPDSRAIAFWEINDSSTRDYLMLNTTDSVYPRVIPVEYPVAGQKPSPFRIGVIQLEDNATGKDVQKTKNLSGKNNIRWMQIQTDPKKGTYLPRMEWAANSREIIVQRLNRSQNETDLLLCDAKTGLTVPVYHEKDTAWIDVFSGDNDDYSMGGWDWLNEGSEFLWVSEKDGWRHLYRISRDGKKQTLITHGNYDIVQIKHVDVKENLVYFMASPDNATQSYLYRCSLDGKGLAERVTPSGEPGTHAYEISPNGKFAVHNYSNYYTAPEVEWLTMPDHQVLNGIQPVKKPNPADSAASSISFFKIITAEGVSMDGWMQKPKSFDSTKKYPVLFYVYSEPAQATVVDEFGITNTLLRLDWLNKEGYIYISLDNRGTPVPKGAAWRKSIFRKIGQVNIRDQAQAAEVIRKWPFVDSSRIAVWGWSCGGSATLNLLFQYPEIYKTGIAVAALTNLETYDNIYQERYMGNPLETKADYIKGSPLHYASGLQGNLLFIHGSGDDNVHYDNAEMLLNALISHNKTFQFMEYPNRTHSLDEGAFTQDHLNKLFKTYLNQHCPGGAK